MPITDYKKYWQDAKTRYDQLLARHVARLKKDFAEAVEEQKKLNKSVLKEAAEWQELENEKKDIAPKLKGIKGRPTFGLEAACKELQESLAACEKLVNEKGKKQDSKTLIAAGQKAVAAQKKFADVFKKVKAFAEALAKNPAYDGAGLSRQNLLLEAAKDIIREADSRATELLMKLKRI